MRVGIWMFENCEDVASARLAGGSLAFIATEEIVILGAQFDGRRWRGDGFDGLAGKEGPLDHVLRKATFRPDPISSRRSLNRSQTSLPKARSTTRMVGLTWGHGIMDWPGIIVGRRGSALRRPTRCHGLCENAQATAQHVPGRGPVQGRTRRTGGPAPRAATELGFRSASSPATCRPGNFDEGNAGARSLTFQNVEELSPTLLSDGPVQSSLVFTLAYHSDHRH